MNVQADDDDFSDGLVETWLKGKLQPVVDEELHYTTETYPGNVLPELNTGDEPVRVPLVIYFGGERKIVGDAVVTGDKIEAFIDPAKGRNIADAITRGVIQTVSVQFNAPPAIPVLENGHVRWKKDY